VVHIERLQNNNQAHKNWTAVLLWIHFKIIYNPIIQMDLFTVNEKISLGKGVNSYKPLSIPVSFMSALYFPLAGEEKSVGAFCSNTLLLLSFISSLSVCVRSGGGEIARWSIKRILGCSRRRRHSALCVCKQFCQLTFARQCSPLENF
jgi:hypothetical protein